MTASEGSGLAGGGWPARLATALFAAIAASVLSAPVWFFSVMAGGPEPLLPILGCPLVGLVAGLMGTGVSRAVVGDDASYRLRAWRVAGGTAAALAVCAIAVPHSTLRAASTPMILLVTAGFAFVGAVIGSAWKEN